MPVAYYAGRGLQLLAMWLLLVDIFTAGPLGPSFNLFAIGALIFLAGWLIARRGGAWKVRAVSGVGRRGPTSEPPGGVQGSPPSKE